MLPPFALERPDRLEDALALIGDDCLPYCGGTELLMAMKLNVLRPSCLVDLKGIAALARVEWRGDSLVIGGAVRHASLAADAEISRSLAVLTVVEQRVGNARVRTQGSIGGNLCFAEPRSDVATLLAALGASITLASSTGQRRIAITDFVLGAYETVREPTELLVEVLVPSARLKSGVYLKHQYAERPTVGVALVREGENGVWRLAVGAVGDVPIVIEVSSLDEIDAEAVADMTDPIEDISGGVDYKQHLVAVYVRRAVQAAAEDLGA
ncbi:MAG: Molybdopterin dehydrogenase, FAD-binding [Acidimicrobiaceae bacterium]|nr:Molybdopterin dehydrogenase, FAD-binding [Acidimicrobiaceae bacterium]